MNSRTAISMLSMTMIVLFAPRPLVLAESGLGNANELLGGRQIDEPNAAELYRAAWVRHAKLMDAFNAERRRTRISVSSVEWTPEKETMAVLRACRPLVEEIIAATRAAEADWGIGETDDFPVELPHLRSLRNSARLLAVDARAQLVLGHHDAAAERIAAIVRMTSHLRLDDIILSVSAAMAICESGLQMTELIIHEGRPEPEHLRPIRDALAALPDDDPFAMLDAIKGERRRSKSVLTDWIEDGGPPEEAPPMLDGPLRFLGAVVIMTQLEHLDAYYEKLIDAWQSDDAADRIAELKKTVDAGEYGIFAYNLAPVMGHVYQADQRARTRIAEVRALLDEHGAGGR